jgi:small subunit ribosomal protein S1
VDVVVLGIDTEQEQISLGMKQIEKNPWEAVKENYPPGSRVVGKVRNLTSYGAFVEIEDGIDGLLHVNDMSWTEKVNHPSQVVNKGDTIETVVLEVNPEKRRVALGLKQLEPDPWEEEIPSKYRAGDIVRGRISKLTNFGAFVELEDGLEGLLHISEMSEKDIDAPEDIVAEGDVVDVRVLRVDQDERKIGLSLLPAAGKAIEGEGPQLVMFSDEIEEAEEPQQLVREILEDAPQNQEREETDEESEDGEDDSARNKGGLNIPADVVSDDKEDAAEDETEETDEDVSETSADVEEENSDERTV